MKSNICRIVTTLAVASSVNCLQSRLPFMTTPARSISKQSQILLNVRGGQLEPEIESIPVDVGEIEPVPESVSIMDEDIVTDRGIQNEMQVEGDDIAATPKSLINNDIIMSMLLPIKSTIENFRSFYLDSLSSYPVQTIALTATITVLLLWCITSMSGSKKEQVVVVKPDKKINTPAHDTVVPVSSQNNEASAFYIGGSRGLITGLSTAVATTFAIYQAISRPSSVEEKSPEINTESTEEEETEYDEFGDSVFKAQEILLNGQRLIKNVRNQIGLGKKSSLLEEELYEDDPNAASY
jgi:hypothetical protein